MVSSKMEFMVENIRDKEEFKKTLLKNPEITRAEIIGNESVIIESSLTSDAAVDLLKQTSGGTAILWGFGDSNAAVAIIEGEGVHGVIRLGTSKENGGLIDGTIDGLPPGHHNLQIHVAGDISEGCNLLGPIWEPKGNLGKILANADGRSNFKFCIPDLQIGQVIGRSIAVATETDEKRYACGIIARSAGLFQNNKKICACDGVTLWDERFLPAAGSQRQRFHQTSDTDSSRKQR